MTINYGKRNPGGLTAASPGDTLYIPFATYNDSGASIAKSGFARTDIEIFKNGGVTPRATDSGYSILTDTGQYGDRVGLHRFSISLFNTSDDPSFYAIGSQYHVAVDAITVDGRTVRFFPAVFEVGTERANVTQVDGDTGFADRLGKFASVLTALGKLDTGSVALPLQSDLRRVDADTGAADQLGKAFATLPSYFQQVDVQRIDGDTGPADNLGQVLTGTIVPTVNVGRIDGDTGAADRLGKFTGSRLSATGHIDTGALAGTQAGTIDANVTHVNQVEVGGVGTVGNPWKPA